MISLITGLLGKVMPGFVKYLPYILAAAVIVGLLWALHHAGYVAGENTVQARWDAEKAAQQKIVAQALEQQKIDTQHALDAAAAAEQHQAQVRVVYRTLTNTVTKYVQSHPTLQSCGLDAAGLQLWNSANSGAASK